MSTYIKDLIRQGEHQQLDFKFAISDSVKIARSLVAFANTRGGILLVGVKDNGAIAGSKAEEEFYMVQAAADMYCQPPVVFSSKTWAVDGKVVLEITVPKSETKPHRTQNDKGQIRAYLRVADENIQANGVMVEVWKRKSNNNAVMLRYSDAEKKLMEYLDIHNTITINKYIQLAQVPYLRARDILVNLILINAIEIVFTATGSYYQLKKHLKTD